MAALGVLCFFCVDQLHDAYIVFDLLSGADICTLIRVLDGCRGVFDNGEDTDSESVTTNSESCHMEFQCILYHDLLTFILTFNVSFFSGNGS